MSPRPPTEPGRTAAAELPGKPVCGTRAAYQRHHRLREPVDQQCRLAAAEYARRRRGPAPGSRLRRNTPVERRAAVLTVCSHAADAGTARLLLDMLGLLPAETPMPTGPGTAAGGGPW